MFIFFNTKSYKIILLNISLQGSWQHDKETERRAWSTKNWTDGGKKQVIQKLAKNLRKKPYNTLNKNF
jgi:hypothetical protein